MTTEKNNISDSLFAEFGIISGKAGRITPEIGIRLGASAATISKRIAVSGSNCGICKLLCNAIISGAGASGAQITEFDASFWAVAAHCARAYLFDLGIFAENDSGGLRLRFCDKFGLPLEKKACEAIKLSTESEPLPELSFTDAVMPKSITGSLDAFSAAYAKDTDLEGFVVSVSGKSLAAKTLKSVLSLCGCRLTSPERGVVVFSVSDDGMQLMVRDEAEQWYDSGHVDALITLAHFLSGGHELALSSDAPASAELLADEFGGRILRMGRDSGSRELFLSQRLFCDAFCKAVFLCSYLKNENSYLRKLVSRLPGFTLISREISLSGSREKVISQLEKAKDGLYKENPGILRVCADGGWVSISPVHSSSSLRITGEAMSEEIASELCNLFIEKAKLLDMSEAF